MSIDDFIFRVEHLQKLYRCPWFVILRDFHMLMSHDAKEWYWLFIKTHSNVDWPKLRNALEKQYQTVTSNFEATCEMAARKQQPGESVDSFFHDMMTLRSKLRPPIDEEEAVRIMKLNLKDSLTRIVYPMTIYSVEHLRDKCREAERYLLRRTPPTMNTMPQKPYPPRPRVSEILEEPAEEETLEIDEVQMPRKKYSSTVICRKCKKPGHIYKECPSMEKKIFCFKCGLDDTVFPKCPKCHPRKDQENSQGNSKTAGQETPN